MLEEAKRLDEACALKPSAAVEVGCFCSVEESLPHETLRIKDMIASILIILPPMLFGVLFFKSGWIII